MGLRFDDSRLGIDKNDFLPQVDEAKTTSIYSEYCYLLNITAIKVEQFTKLNHNVEARYRQLLQNDFFDANIFGKTQSSFLINKF